MSWTKGQLVDAALQELSIAQGDGFGVSDGEKTRALARLDAMMGTWAAKGVRVGYAFPASPDASSLDTPSGIPESAVETVFLNLAQRLAPGYGKQLNPETVMAARTGYDTLLWAAAQPIEQELPHTTPKGAGNKPWRTVNQPFLPRPDTDPLRVGDDGNFNILQE